MATVTTPEAARHLAVDQPILNNPFREPTRHWLYEGGEPRIAEGRRPAGYYFRERRTGVPQLSFFQDEQYNDLPVINELRKQVGRWREDQRYPGVTEITRQLLRYWQRPDRERQLFFCQIEAVETAIWLLETDAGRRFLKGTPSLALPVHGEGIGPSPRVRGDYRLAVGPTGSGFTRQSARPPVDGGTTGGGRHAARGGGLPLDGSLHRLGCKMATGSGKTVVMAMIAAWSVLNKAHAAGRSRFSDAILVVCPNLTVKERLGGAPRDSGGGDRREPARPLIPGARGNYYEAFDLVPPALLPALGRGHVLITNWHAFLPQDDGRRRGVVQRGAESDAAFCARVLRDLGNARNILVLNDEAHHCYRPRPEVEQEDQVPTGQERREVEEQNEEATVWIDGLERVQAVRGLLGCVDLSATPFFISGSGYPEGTPFPWLVSDFGLVDAIESGIVKVPRVPVASDSGRPDPEYFRLWETIMARLQSHERGEGRRKPKPEAVLREADGALKQLAGEWVETLRAFDRDRFPVPPCLIAVCDNTEISELLFERIAQEGAVFPEHLRNEDEREVTIRIDTKLLNKAEQANGEGSTREERAEALRRKVSTVGKKGEPGEQVRCVVSVGMLTEGWDAHNVTHILGVRAFKSQLLCEQVVGRGLRRMNYDFELDEHGVPLHVEYVDVYGIPFEVIPVKKRSTDRPPSPPTETTLVQALKDRETPFEISFPRVEGYVYEVHDRIAADVDRVEQVRIDPSVQPTATIVRAKVGYELGTPALRGPGETETQTRAEFYRSVRWQQIEYELSRRIVVALVGQDRFRHAARHRLFPQVLAVVRRYLAERVDYGTIDRREVGLEGYAQLIVERLLTAIRPVDDNRPRLLPRLERFRPRGSTAEVTFRTARECRQTLKSHISHVVLDTATWEASVAYQLEMSQQVQSYARNDHLELVIPYTFLGGQHLFYPDYLVRLANGLHLLLEVKGLETEQDRAKYEAAKRWVEAVNTWGEMGRWDFKVCKDPRDLRRTVETIAKEQWTALCAGTKEPPR